MCILCPLLSLQWEQMQQMEEKEAGALRGICTDFDYRADVKLKHWSLFFYARKQNFSAGKNMTTWTYCIYFVF